MANDKQKPLSVQQQLTAASESAQRAGDNVRHGLLHAIDMKVAELVYTARDSERVLQGDDLVLIRRLRAVLTDTEVVAR